MKESFDPSVEIHPAYEHVLADLVGGKNCPVLIGGAAVVLYGSRRLTGDIDIQHPDLSEAVHTLYRNDFQVLYKKFYDENTKETIYETIETEKDALQFLMDNKRPAFKAVHSKFKVELDVWLNPGISYEDVLADSQIMRLGSVEIPVASAKHLLELKKLAVKENPARADIDEPDIRFLRQVVDRGEKKVRPKNPPYPDPDEFT